MTAASPTTGQINSRTFFIGGGRAPAPDPLSAPQARSPQARRADARGTLPWEPGGPTRMLLHPRGITMAAPLLNLNGYTDLPAGKIAAVVTYLEMRTRPRLKRVPQGRAWRLERLNGDGDRYRALFRRVGEDWLWFSRAVMTDDGLLALLSHPKVEAYALVQGEADLGLLELDFRLRGEAELSFFGLVPEAIGSGAGRHLMNAAIRRAFREPIRRLFLHT